jgi:RHS repeat-associated protein
MYRTLDGLGSTSELLDSAGAVIGSYKYDVFGAVRNHSGSSSEFSFTGEQNDLTGFEFLRARYYDPEVGRFLGRDRVDSSHFLHLVILPIGQT